jgi:prepilin-type processing-associated H-X9-DG protein
MRAFRLRNERSAFTVVELLAIVVVLFFLALLFVPDRPVFPRARVASTRIHCVNNLKQVGLAARMWSDDNNSMYPMTALSLESYGGISSNATNAFIYFQSMSNELSTPKILVCPKETQRIAATNFSTDFNNSHLSYFLGLDASETNGGSFLAGDRNLVNGHHLLNGVLNVQTNQNVGWTFELHDQSGNVAMGDGSVQQLTGTGLKAVLAGTGFTTNRLLFP